MAGLVFKEFWEKIRLSHYNFYSIDEAVAATTTSSVQADTIKLLFGANANQFVPFVGKVSLQVYALSPFRCPEWSIYCAVAIIRKSKNMSVILLTALEIESLQSWDNSFLIDFETVKEPWSPSHCFSVLRNCIELRDEHERAPLTRKTPVVELNYLVKELRQIRCVNFENHSHEQLLRCLHVIIMVAGVKGLYFLKRSHYLRDAEGLAMIYVCMQWVCRSDRLFRALRLPFGDPGIEREHLDWVQRFGDCIYRSVFYNQGGISGSAIESYDGILPGVKCQMTFDQLIEALGDASQSSGQANIVHAHVQNGLTLQWEEDAGKIPFSDLVKTLMKNSKTKQCHARCSIQLKWTLLLAECAFGRGRTFCRILREKGLHCFSGPDLDLMQCSAGWIEGFTMPYFMCRQGGTFVGHTEQVGSAAFGCLLKDSGAVMKWEAMYVPHGLIGSALKSFSKHLASCMRGSDHDYYPGPLLWSDHAEGQMVLESLGIVPVYGHVFHQDPSAFALTATSRMFGDYGLFLQYHQTCTEKETGDPIVLFSQNLVPYKLDWCKIVSEKLSDKSSGADSIVRCWGLGFLLFMKRRKLSFDPSFVEAARDSMLKEIIIPLLNDFFDMGESFKQADIFFDNLEKVYFPCDLYEGIPGDKGEELQIFRPIVCEGCGLVLTGLLSETDGYYRCMLCSESCNGLLFPIDSLMSLLSSTSIPKPVVTMKKHNELVGVIGAAKADEVKTMTLTQSFKNSQKILATLFRLEEGVLVAAVGLSSGTEIPVSWTLDAPPGVTVANLLVAHSPKEMYHKKLLYFGIAQNLQFGKSGNCKLKFRKCIKKNRTLMLLKFLKNINRDEKIVCQGEEK